MTGAAAQDLASQMVGVWKRTGMVQKILTTGETRKAEGENPSGMLIFSQSGYFMWIFIADGRKSPASLPPTDAERIYLYNTGLSGGGTYTVNGDKVTILHTASTNEAFTGTERVTTVQMSGKMLIWTSVPFKTADGKEAIGLHTFERLE
jgi:Lipocalin-like domain